MFSAEQYRALHESVGLVNRSGRGQLSFTGADRRGFLQGLLTNDIQALEAGSGCYAALLTANGRMIADMRVLEIGDRLMMDVDAGQAAALRDRFDQIIFSEDAQVVDISSSWRELGVYGPQAARAITSAFAVGMEAAALEALALYSNHSFDTGNGEATVVRSDEIGIDGFDVVVQASQSDSIAAHLRAAGAMDIAPETAEVTRIEAGRPRFGVDMNEDTIPLEAGIEDRAISLTKGCYVGQEIIIRVLHRGHGRVAKRLSGLTFDPSAAVPVAGDVVLSGDRQIGVVTSATQSPALSRPIAMAYVHRDFAERSTSVVVISGGKGQPAFVSPLPFVGRTIDGPEGPPPHVLSSRL
jgi:folate-binding protein YgfZ